MGMPVYRHISEILQVQFQTTVIKQCGSNNPIKKGEEDLERHFSKDRQMAKKKKKGENMLNTTNH